MASPWAHNWDLDPATIYLNHGSFGPSPSVVKEARKTWSARLERQPMRFFCEEMEDHLDLAAKSLADFLQTKPSRLALVDNATIAMNIVAASTKLQPGDEVLLTDHEYGAVRNIWNARCRETGATVKTVAVPLPLSAEQVLDQFRNALSERTQMVVVSHVTSPTATILPVREICQLTKSRGIPTTIDGPHAVAMLEFRLNDLGCDFYCGSGHKWLCASFGSGFLWAHPRHHSSIRMPIVGWGGSISGRQKRWQDPINWQGTRDPAALLSIPAAIDFLKEIGRKTFRNHAHKLICVARNRLLNIEGTSSLFATSESDFVSMASIGLPQPADWKPGYHGHPDPMQVELRRKHGIELPVGSWNGHRFLRVSAHLYNDADQINTMVDAVENARHLRR